MLDSARKPELVGGLCSASFSTVAEAFEDWAERDPMTGMAVSVFHHGEVVVDLWSGFADLEGLKRWDENTIVCMMSVAKGVSALCIHHLSDRGLLDLDAPAAAYWPEFAAKGKGDIRIRHLLDHSAGLPFVSQPVDPVSALDGTTMIHALERETPRADPGVERAYHPVTMGYLLAEIVRRVTGISLGEYFNREIAAPHRLEYWIGLPNDQHARCAEIGGDIENTIFGASCRDSDSILGRAMRQVTPELLNSASFRSAEIPSINGHGNARAIATLYGLLSQRDRLGLLSAAALQRAVELQWSDVEQTMGHRRNMAMGFILAADNVPMGPGPRSFGHPGAGGSIGFGDLDRGLGVCFTTNRLYAGHDLNPRMVDVCNSVFRASGLGSHHAD